MLYKYKEHNFMSIMVTKEVLDLSFPPDKWVFLNIAISCSSKFHALLGFVFDNAFAFVDLINAFRDDEPFKGYLNDLSCYNNFVDRSK